MATNPRIHLYVNDWETEKTLMGAGPALRGTWFEMMCVMAAAPRYGYFMVGDKPCPIADFAARLNTSRRQAARLIADLEQRGVFSRDEDGIAYSRRMARDGENMDTKTKVKRKKTPRIVSTQCDPNQPELFENPKKTRTRARPPSSLSPFPSMSNLPSSPEAAREPPEPEDEKHETGDLRAGIEVVRRRRYRFRPIGRAIRAPPPCPILAADIRAKWLFGLYHYGRRRFGDVAVGELITLCDAALRAGSRAATPREITHQLDQLDTLRRREQHQHGIAA
jgi:hypothetical protein